MQWYQPTACPWCSSMTGIHYTWCPAFSRSTGPGGDWATLPSTSTITLKDFSMAQSEKEPVRRLFEFWVVTGDEPNESVHHDHVVAQDSNDALVKVARKWPEGKIFVNELVFKL